MCHEPRARPPAPPLPLVAGAAGPAGGRLVLTSADGNRFIAFAARTEATEAPAVVIMPDVRGLHPFYQDLTLRFAEAGVDAVAIDYFGRTAGAEPRDDAFDFMSHMQHVTPDGIAADVAAAVAHLRSADGGTAGVFTVGFCFGGRNSFNQAAEGHGLAGVIGFYGSLRAFYEGDPNTPILRAPAYRTSLLGLFGGGDPGIPPDQIEEFRAGLRQAGIEFDIMVYEGAPHSFFDRSFEEYREACDDAWRRVLAFIQATP